jgi:dTDP-4-amino-4,6-dideoxygalactose transaminase
VAQLAFLGGTPRFSEKLHVGRPNVGNRDDLLRRINEMLDRRWFSNNGQLVQEFEAALAKYLGVKHCVAVCNATIALEIATRALDLSGEVIVPSFTFVATAHCLQWQGITPVFCDVDPTTHLMDPEKLEALITPKTTGILGVHTWGQGCNPGQLQDIADRNGLALLFDAAHAFGCTHQGQKIGHFGLAEVFSFHATKFLNSFEGGAVATNDEELASRIRLMKNFGFAGYDKVVYIGTNGKMSEPCAAMGLTSLESIDEFIKVNQAHYQHYFELLNPLPGVRVLPFDPGEKNNCQYVVVEIDEPSFGIDRDLLVKVLWAENVIARRYFFPGCHQMEPYRTLFPESKEHLPETEKLSRRTLILPTGTAICPGDIEAIALIIQQAAECSRELTARS